MHCGTWGLVLVRLAVAITVAGAGRADAAPAPAPQALLQSLGPSFEDGWNQLLVGWLRAERARSPEARPLRRRCEQVAAAESLARGTRIAADALALATRWGPPLRRLRIRAAEAESLALATRLRDSTTSAPAYREAIDLYRRLGDGRREAVALGGLGVALLFGGDVPGARLTYHEALQRRREIGDSVLVGNTLFDLGECARRLVRLEESRALFEHSARVRAGTGERAKQGSARSLMGSVLLDLGRTDEALSECQAAVELLLAPPVDGRRLAEGWSNLGRAALAAHAFAIADRALARVGAMADSLGFSHLRSALADNLAERDLQRGRFSDALAALRQSEAAAANGADSLFARNRIGWVHLLTGRVDRAREVLSEVRATADERHVAGARILARIHLALVEQIDGSPDRAERWAREALGLAREIGDSASVERCLAGLGDVALARRRPAEALLWYERSIAARPQRDPGTDLALRVNAAVARIGAGDLDAAERALEEIAERSRAAGLAEFRSTALLALADIDERRGNWARAVERGRTVLAYEDSMRSLQSAEEQAIAVLAQRHFEFTWYVGFLNRLDDREPGRGWSEEAFAWSERARARSLMDRMLESRAISARARPATLRAVQQRLGGSDALLYYSVGDSTSAVWAVRRDRWRRVTLPAGPALRIRAESARQMIARREADPGGREDPSRRGATDDRRLRELYEILVRPVESLLAGARTVLVVPDGALHRLPFEALVRGEGRRGRYLVERWAVAYAPSASLVGVTTPSAAAAHAVVVGDPLYATDDARGGTRGEEDQPDDRSAPLANLPHTGEEIAALESLLGRGAMDVHRGAAASRAGLLGDPARLRTAWLLHFATHGEANENEPANGGLWLTPDPGTSAPSMLAVGDVLDLKLAARQVTLSACETGLGRLERGEGVLGLARAFLAAGAQSVTVSLWKVSDASTARLMRAFYAEALRPRVSRAEALARAKRRIIGEPGGPGPFHWAPFVLVGDPGPLQAPAARH